MKARRTEMILVGVVVAALVGPAWVSAQSTEAPAPSRVEVPGAPQSVPAPESPPPAPSQVPAPTAPVVSPYEPRPADALRHEQASHQVRYQVHLFEGVLERAVTHAADMLTRRIRALSPGVVMLTGTPRARGLLLEGYGALFTVDVPSMNPSINWSLSQLAARNYLGLDTALDQLRRIIAAEDDQKTRADAERALRTIEMQVGPSRTTASQVAPRGAIPGAAPVSASSVEQAANAAEAGAASSATTPSQAPETAGFIGDPNEAYEQEVKVALIDAMLDHSGRVQIGVSEWLTLAARDADSTVMPLGGAAVTVLMRISGADLAEFRAGRLSRDEARRRVVVSEF